MAVDLVLYSVPAVANPADVVLRQAASAAPVQFSGLFVFYDDGGGGAAIELSLIAPSDAPAGNQVRLSKNGTTVVVYLVPITDTFASKVRVQTSSGVMAVRLRT